MRRTSLPNILCLAVLLAIAACTVSQDVQNLPDGVVVKTSGDGHQVRVQVLSENILRVTAARDTFSSAKSLIVLPDAVRPVAWQVDETAAHVTVTTPRITAKITRGTGEVTFLDSKGEIILREKSGGRMFERIKIDDDSTFRIQQVFESPEDEALYGLGGHQNGQMNYKGGDVELAQHNIVDVIPFLYSTRNYGLLWDNYSISNFGDPRAYQPLNSLQLFSRDGKPGGLTADYYVNGKIVRSFIEDKIGYEFLETPEVDNFPKDVSEKGKVIWEGSFSSEIEGTHKFQVYASNYFKVWVDGRLIMDKWRQNWNPWTNKFDVPMKKSERHTLKIEWIPQGGFMAVKHLDPLPPDQQKNLTLTSEAGDQIDYYFVAGRNADEVISGYRQLTGKAPIVPKWAMGYWQSRERYRNQQELINVVKEYRSREIPLDNIVLDWQYWEDPKWGSHEFDATRFPDPAGMMKTLHQDLHANLMISVWPKFNKGTEHYDEMNRNGFLFTNNINRKRKDWVGVGYESTFYDPFNPAAGALFWNQIDRKLNRLGVDAWWLDATEPDMHSNLSIEERKKNMSPTAIGPGAKYFNAYSLLNSRSVYEGSRKSSPDKRVFILTRSAFAGQQRYGAATWSGDIVSRWSDFSDQIAAGINFSLSGIPYWTMDIGGFAVESRYYDAKGETLEEWRELNARWFQFGAFCPLFRSHGQYPFREIYNIAPENHEAYQSMVYYDKMRYQLLPYIYSMAGWSYFKDYTLMRGLVMDFPNDARVRTIGDQYMFGPSLLVSPVTEFKARERSVYLPAGTGWFDLYTGKLFNGGQSVQADAPLSRMPLFVRQGSILPVGPALQFTSEKPADPVTLYVYTGANASFDLYEDEGTNYNYENGEYSTIPMRYDEQSRTLTIDARQGSFKNMRSERDFRIVWVSGNKPVGMKPEGVSPHTVVHYTGSAVTAKFE